MTIAYHPSACPNVSKLTLSTWVYVSSKAAKQAVTDAEKMVTNKNAREGDLGVHKRIPIMQFGRSVRPRLGVHVNMGTQMFAFLGVCLWFPYAGDIFLTRNMFAQLFIGTLGASRDGWYAVNPFWSQVGIKHSDRWLTMWRVLEDLIPILFTFSTEMLGSASTLYARIDHSCGPGVIPNYNGFNDYGMNPAGITDGGGCDLPIRPWTLRRAHQTSWTFTGVFEATGDLALGIKKGDQAKEGKLINYFLYFGRWLLGSTPVTETLQPTPTTGPDGFGMIRMPEAFGGGRYFAFGDIVIMFPPYPGVDGEAITYAGAGASLAVPSTLYVRATPNADDTPGGSGSVTFLMTGPYPPQAHNANHQFEGGTALRDADPFVPTLTFTGGPFKLDSWNHIFLTVDLTAMQMQGGSTNMLEAYKYSVPLRPPVMASPPKSAFIVNGQTSKEEPTGSFPVFMDHVFRMAGGQAGLPLIQQDIGRCKITGRNQTIRYHNTMIWFDKYIEPTKENLAFFYRKSKNKKFNNVIPPPSQTAAAKKFGKPNIWMYRDSGASPGDPPVGTPPSTGIRFEKNHGTLSDLILVGTKPKDYRPGPGQSPGTDTRKPPGQ